TNFGPSHSHFSVVRPVRVDDAGRFLSHAVSHRPAADTRVFYRLQHGDRELLLNLTLNPHLLSQDHVVETRQAGVGTGNGTGQRAENACHLLGTVTDGHAQGTAAVSTCNGLVSSAGHSVEPGHTASTDLISIQLISIRPSQLGTYSKQVELDRELWEQEQPDRTGPDRPGRRQISRRSVSRERWVETMVVADSKLQQYHGNNNVESYIFTIMNMVAGIFHDASIGNAIHIILVRLILLQGEEKGLKIVHHADSTLSSFCSWQKNVNPQSDTHPAHHDVAVLITRKDLCAGRNEPCETLGLSHLSGMCQPHRSCNINEDSGLPVAFTIAHELGHSFGLQHDGQGNDCELDGRNPFIMSRQLQYDSSPLTWSSCSKEYITRFLDRGWGFCLDDRPSKKDLTTALVAPGVRYTAQHQCQMQYGPNATFCSEIDNVCQILWCSVNGSCRSKLDAPIDGTRCGPGKWCISGECVIVGKLPETVNGGWGQWSTWSHCSRTCSSGVQSAERECDQPKPAFGGKYCTGERKRYRICNTTPCAQKHPTFREMQCSEFDTVPYHNQLYQWIPVSSISHPCELHCRPVNEDFSEKMLDAVTDGTPCFSNNSRSICINGVCKAVGCDYGIDSKVKEDRCGVCLGDGSSCETVRDSYTERDGYGYVDMLLIPEGARDILIQEVQEAGNFLAVRAADSEEYFLNGNYIIQWNGEYRVGGAKFYYDRYGNLENLTSPGPTTQPVMVQLLFQEPNPGVRFEFTVKKSLLTGNELLEPEYSWKYGAWTDCSASCGLGEQQQPVRCFEEDMGVVDEALCDPNTRPDDRHRRCKNMDCPARWWVGGWQPCSSSCGSGGLRKRAVLCVRTVGGEERVLPPGDCKHLPKPKPAVPCNRDVTCGSTWAVGNWSEVRLLGHRVWFLVCFACFLSFPSGYSSTDCPFLSYGGEERESAFTIRPPLTTTAPPHTPLTTAEPHCTAEPTRVLLTTSTPAIKTHAYTKVAVATVRDHPHNGHNAEATAHPHTTPASYAPTRKTVRNGSGQSGRDHAPAVTHTKLKKILTPRSPSKAKRQKTPAHAPGGAGPNTAAFWVVGNWSECSVSCGLGAVWRRVSCSSGLDADCSSVKKPEPAQHCNLKPCASWHTSNWSRCAEGCVGGTKQRDVQCVDSQSGRALRPFHCQALAPRPPRTLPCTTRTCLQWAHLPWGPCSKSCGDGVMERLVFCPEEGRCNAALRPNSTAPCNLQPCVAWTTDPWQECSVSCGDGVQKRVVRCTNTDSGEQEKSSLCPKNNRPDSVRKCSLEEYVPACKRNSMSTRFCAKLKLLGRCVLRSIRRQCCLTCRT
uniref:ADAM metallopeptidase with thrombospondin type 1 motif, 12 n=1 Tax=Pygocentrus nattereri TaxID=42514 RepID=A0AAR2KE55_PYGNA